MRRLLAIALGVSAVVLLAVAAAALASSATTNLLARVLRSRFATDAEYWAYAKQTLFDPGGAETAVLETDADGTWIASSYLWASTPTGPASAC
jgi:hypothetical protein